jgi:hypothetical protein
MYVETLTDTIANNPKRLPNTLLRLSRYLDRRRKRHCRRPHTSHFRNDILRQCYRIVRGGESGLEYRNRRAVEFE